MTISPEERFDAYRAQRVFGSLNGLRFICIVMVLWHHGTIWGQMEDPALLLTRGFAGVDFFFVLSGYLITTLLLREESRNGWFSIVDFYRRRALRILPVYMLSVSLISFWWIVVRGQDELIAKLPYYYFFGANFLIEDIPLLSPMWSLAVEEQYYLVWPALLFVVPTLRARAVLLTVLIAVCVAAAGRILPEIEPFPPTDVARFVLPTSSYAAILIGSGTALVLHHKSSFGLAWTIVGRRWAAVFALAATMLSMQLLPPVLMGWPNLIVHGLMAMTVAALVAREDHAAAKALTKGFVSRVGQISYGIYIWHLLGLHLGNEVAAGLGLEGWVGAWVAMIVYLVASFAIAEISFRFFESWFLRLKSRRSRASTGA